MFRSYPLTVAITLAAALPALAETTVAEVTDAAFFSRDADGNGRISAGEATGFAALAFAAMDADDDALITLAEFQEWDLGFDPLATANDRAPQMLNAKNAIFRQVDEDADTRMSLMELKVHVARDFAASDIDGDGQLTPFEASARSPWVTALLRAAQP